MGGEDIMSSYPLVNSYIQRWRDCGRTPTAFLSAADTAKPVEEPVPVVSEVPNQQPADMTKEWRLIQDNPVCYDVMIVKLP